MAAAPLYLVWANQLTRLPCLVIYVKFQFVYTTTSKIGSQLLLASTSSYVLLGRGSEKAFIECLGVSIAALVRMWQRYYKCKVGLTIGV